jgi:hypothetical protein
MATRSSSAVESARRNEARWAEVCCPDSGGLIRITVPEVNRLSIYINENDASEMQQKMEARGTRFMNRARGVSQVPGGYEANRFEAYETDLAELCPLPIEAWFDGQSCILTRPPSM